MIRLIIELTEKELRDKKVLLRVDFNVPVKNGKITDTYRILAHKETVDYLISQGADYYVSVRFDGVTKSLMADAWPVWVVKPETNKKIYKYKMLAYTDTYVIIQLVPDKQLPK